MLCIPDCGFCFGQRNEVSFDDGTRLPQFQMLIEELVHRETAGLIVVMRERAILPLDIVRNAKHGVMLFQFGQTFGFQFFCPVVSGSHTKRTRCQKRGQFNVAGIHSQIAGIFTGASTLHRG